MANHWAADSPTLPPIRHLLPRETNEAISRRSTADNNHATPNTFHASLPRSKAEEDALGVLTSRFHRPSSPPREPNKATSTFVDPANTEDVPRRPAEPVAEPKQDLKDNPEVAPKADPKQDLKDNPNVTPKADPKAKDKAKDKRNDKPKKNIIGSKNYTLLSSSPPTTSSDPDAHVPNIFDPRRPATYHTFVSMMQRGDFITGTKAILVDPVTGTDVANRAYGMEELRAERGGLETRVLEWVRPERERGFEAVFEKRSLAVRRFELHRRLGSQL
ncbi:MAG: hypothetical protein Q9200_006768, partial [Gallowayella weberi]